MLIATYLAPGRGDSISNILTLLWAVGILLIVISMILPAMPEGRAFMKEKVSMTQYILPPGIVAGSVMVMTGTIFRFRFLKGRKTI